jgi:hypothetical protein
MFGIQISVVLTERRDKSETDQNEISASLNSPC